MSYCSSNGLTGYDTNEVTFYSHLNTFLSSPSGSYISSSVIFDGSSNIIASRIQTQFKDMSTFNDGRRQEDAGRVVDAMHDVRAVDWSVSAFPWSCKYGLRLLFLFLAFLD